MAIKPPHTSFHFYTAVTLTLSYFFLEGHTCFYAIIYGLGLNIIAIIYLVTSNR